MQQDQNRVNESSGREEPGGHPARVATFVPQQFQPQRGRQSNIALASLMVGLGSLLVCMLNFFVASPLILSAGMAVAGGSLGISAICQIKRSGKRLGGLGSAIGGIVASCGTLLLIVIALIVVWEMRVIDSARAVLFTVDMRELNRAVISYADEHNGEFPDPARWKKELAAYLGGNPEKVLKYGFRPSSGRGFAMNQSLMDSPWGKNYNLLCEKAANPGRTVMFFEAKLGEPAGGPELLPEESTGRRGYVIGFLNGYVESVPKDRLSELIWTPQSK